eukprot:CAMPEP_0117693932 /NCGR_PEP_ID=MMETSP0804-20121206/27163_1 /TAXON_ID=1074897 /ORGANISM="Tetraselmis astigmatica, Strain CCMP880" /LENGTH=345 /DNA_ID=CAMNT_0005507557 /DNA_START=307 /DNA_END=1346 /DNA_ORIENTATION=+
MGGGAPPPSDSSGGTSSISAGNSAVAGAISGCVARFVIGPLDVLKIRFQVQVEPVSRRAAARLAAQKGAAVTLPKYTGIWQATSDYCEGGGDSGTLARDAAWAAPHGAVLHCAELNQAKTFAKANGLQDSPWAPAVSFASGAFAGVAATVASYPFDLLRTTLAAQGEPKVYNSMFSAATGIFQARGFAGLYAGLKPTLIEIIPYSAMQFGLYDIFNTGMTEMRYRALSSMPWQRPRPKEEIRPNAVQQFLCGLLAGTCAKLSTHPLDVAKKRFQIVGLVRDAKYGARFDVASTQGLWACIRTIAKTEGFAGLYKGAAPSILKSAPQSAVTFAVYEYVLRELKKRE